MTTRKPSLIQDQQAVLNVTDLFARRGNAIILDHLNWQVNQGEHWVILGANGAGKTSLLNALTGYLAPFQGEVELLGHTYGKTDWREVRKLLGIVTSRMREHIPARETALEVVLSGLHAMLGYWGDLPPKETAQAEQQLHALGLGHLTYRRWETFSQGERQKLLIARALINNPRILILDESCAGLDPVARAEFLSFIDKLAHGNSAPTIITVTHHVEEITASTTHALLLKSARAHASGPIHQVLNAENLSSLYNHPVSIEKTAKGTWTAQVLPSA